MNNNKVLIGMSGGVDSTASALILKEEGYDLEGVYMKLHDSPKYHKIHLERARVAAEFIGIKLHVLDLLDIFEAKVFKPFIDTYALGETPNPCVLCNRELKFGEMIKFADKIGAKYLATGHYIKTDGTFFYQASDSTKDQSYFLFYVKKEVLPRLIFPLANKHKTNIKEIISSIEGLELFASQKESSEICFVETTYTDVIKDYLNVENIGEVLDKNGKIIGKHKGYMHYTIGKRRGFTVDGAHEPHFVTNIDAKNNTITVGKKNELECNKVILNNLNMFIDKVKFETEVKLRYRTKAIKCSVKIEENIAYIYLKESVFGVASGQAAVFYDNDKLIGGGWIKEVFTV